MEAKYIVRQWKTLKGCKDNRSSGSNAWKEGFFANVAELIALQVPFGSYHAFYDKEGNHISEWKLRELMRCGNRVQLVKMPTEVYNC